ncbi:hypothetical protein [Desulfonatronovibrio hydrogenovorans]|uniref:hypothetical protein n=1 Tax=Desulfonatronovibrio hydrogenovorans TaxID=53245 RepID=UPI00048CC0CD|nr:hypothetical protein [Desulfonatronovibrio hydrogenovorans]
MRESFKPVPNVPINNIKLDIFNFRYYGQLSSQRDCVKAMLNDKNSGLLNIAKDIAQNGLTPDPIVISKDDADEWVVREGNRRITALKLLNQPAIIEDHPLYHKFKDISNNYQQNFPKAVDCLACDNEDTILEYLDRVHGGFKDGIGRRWWSADNKTFYNMHRGKPGENALAIKAKQIAVENGASIKEPYFITNLQRVLQNSGVQKMLGMSWDGQGIIASVDKGLFISILKEIVMKTADKTSRDLYLADEQQKFVADILKALDVDVEAAGTEPYSLDPEDPKSPSSKPSKRKTGRTPIKPTWDRKRLINPVKTTLKISDIQENRKARDIYLELARKIDVREATNAASVLLRVLLELSVNHYLRKHSLCDKNALHKNIKQIVGDMFNSGKLKKNYHDEMLRFCAHDELLSAKSLQRLVHSPDFNPDPRTICTLWDNIEKFVTLCWK